MNLNEAQSKTRKSKKSLAEEMLDELLAPNIPFSKKPQNNTLVIGKPGTMKSSGTVNFLTKDLEEGEFITIIDIDDSATETIRLFYNEDYENNKIIIKQPYSTKVDKGGNSVIDFIKSMDTIKNTAGATELMLKRDINIKALVVDGISKLLEWAGNQMEIEEGIEKSDRQAKKDFKWDVYETRKKHFNEVIEMLLHLKIPVYFLAHDDFLPNKEGELAKVKGGLHESVDNVLVFSQSYDYKNPSITNFEAKILKDRAHITNIQKSVVFASADNEKNEYNINPEKAFNLITESENEVKS